MEKKVRKKIYSSLAEVERDFFPVLYKERIENNQSKEANEIGIKIAKDILNHAKQQILK